MIFFKNFSKVFSQALELHLSHADTILLISDSPDGREDIHDLLRGHHLPRLILPDQPDLGRGGNGVC